MTLPADRLDEFIAAYRAELGAVRSGGSSKRVELERGRVTHRGDSNSVVTFANPGMITLNEGDEARLTIGSSTHDVVLLGVSHDELAFSVPAALKQRVDTATLELDVGFLYLAVLKRLESIKKTGAESFFSPEIGNWVVRTDLPEYDDVLHVNTDGLNELQAGAVRTMLRSRASFVWGPPGTGKTSTVAAAVRDLVNVGRSVLLVSTTNAAVDVLTLKVASLLAVGGHLPSGVIVRDGYPTPELAAAYDGALTHDALLRSLGRDERDLLRKVETALKQAEAHQARFQQMGERYVAYREQWRARYVELKDAHARLMDLADDADDVALESAQVVATTVHRVATGKVPRRFDAVIIDEASMINLPLVWLSAGQAKLQIVVAGDFRQLGPISQAAPSATTAVLRTSAFEESGIARSPRVDQHPNLAALSEQYRMINPISELVSKHFYPDSPLRVAAPVAGRTPRPAIPSLPPLVRIDLSGHQMWAGRSLGEKSRYNLANAAVVGALARRAAKDGTSLGAERLIAITPYRAQAATLASVLGRFASAPEGTGHRTMASTVHRYQGGEAHTVILDLTDAHGTWVSQFFTGEGLDSDTSRLINVAISRAQDQLIIIGDFSRILATTPPRSPVHNALSAFRTDAIPVTIEQLAVSLADEDDFTVFDSDPATQVLDDINTAEQRIVVFSDHIGPQLRDEFLAVTKHAIANGATARVVTSPPGAGVDEQSREKVLEWFDEMAAAGITVDLRSAPGGYESAVIVDNAIWIGRNRNTTGILGETPSPTAIRTVSPALVSEALVHMERRAPRGYKTPTGMGTVQCDQCERPMAFADTYQNQYLYCPYCEPNRAPGARSASDKDINAAPTRRRYEPEASEPLPQAQVAAPLPVCPSCGVVIRPGGLCRCSV